MYILFMVIRKYHIHRLSLLFFSTDQREWEAREGMRPLPPPNSRVCFFLETPKSPHACLLG